MTENGHLPVLPTEVIAFLDAGRDGTYIDCTLGLAGHALALLERNPARPPHRPGPRRRVLGDRPREAQALRQAGHALPGRLQRPARARHPLRQGPRRPGRPRHLLLPAGFPGTGLQLHARRAPGHAHGPAVEDDRGQDPPHLPGAEAGRDPREVRRARPDPAAGPGDRPPAQARPARNDRRPQAPHRARSISGGPRKAASIPRPRPSRRSASRSTRSSKGSAPSSTGRSVSPRRARGSSSSPSTRSRTASSSRPSTPWPRPEDGAPLLAILTKKPVMASDAEVAANSRARSAKLRAAERV